MFSSTQGHLPVYNTGPGDVRLSGYLRAAGNGYHRLFKDIVSPFHGGCREPRGRGKGLAQLTKYVSTARVMPLYTKSAHMRAAALYRQAWRLLETMTPLHGDCGTPLRRGVPVMTGATTTPGCIYFLGRSDVCNVSGLAARRRIGVFYGEGGQARADCNLLRDRVRPGAAAALVPDIPLTP